MDSLPTRVKHHSIQCARERVGAPKASPLTRPRQVNRDREGRSAGMRSFAGSDPGNKEIKWAEK